MSEPQPQQGKEEMLGYLGAGISGGVGVTTWTEGESVCAWAVGSTSKKLDARQRGVSLLPSLPG